MNHSIKCLLLDLFNDYVGAYVETDPWWNGIYTELNRLCRIAAPAYPQRLP